MLAMGQDFDRLIKAAKELHGIEGNSAVAQFLGIEDNPDQVMTNWKSRGVPKSKITGISRKLGCNPFWLEFNEGMMKLVVAETATEAKIIEALHQMAHQGRQDSITTVLQISDSLAQYKPQNGTQ